MILVLGGGWTGTRLCRLDTSRFITTTRTAEKLSELTAMGINAVQFDLQKEETWSNLPPKSDIEATVITFAILDTQLPELKRLWETHLATDRPIICFGTSSCFQGDNNHESIVNETAPLTGISTRGTPLTDRVKGEEWILAKGATVLHLSGIVGDEEEGEYSGYGPPRTIKSFLSKGYLRNGLKLINCIHINDICIIILTLIKKIKDGNVPDPVCGQRILTSCGAFRAQEWTQTLNVDPLPEMLPPHSTMESSKILSTAKLLSLLPANYEWTLPVAGVEPVSRGLPTTGPQKTDADGAAYDRQWELLKKNFRGKWQAKTVWYKKDKGEERGGKLEHQTFIAEMKGATLPAPVLTIDKTQYHIYFLDADTGVWHGTGLRFTPNGEKILPLSRKSYNDAGKAFLFQGMGGQCSVDTNLNVFATELNFFHERSRSMIIAMYALDSTSGRLLLDSVGIAPFRCGLGCGFPLKPPQSEVRGNIDNFLQSLRGKMCRRQWRSYTRALDETDGGELCEFPTSSIQFFSDPERVVQLFDDDLVCSIPADIQAGGGCELVFGCFHTPDYAQIVTLTYDTNGKIERYTIEKWS